MELQYSPVKLEEISEGLNRMFTSMQEKSGSDIARASHNNFVVVAAFTATNKVERLAAEERLEQFIRVLSTAQPSRFIVVTFDESVEGIKGEIAAHCQGATRDERYCSELIRLTAGAAQLPALTALVRSNLTPGMGTDLYIYEPTISEEVIDALLPLAEKVFFDSSEFESRFSLLAHVSELSNKLVDLQWVRLSGWRDQVKTVFEDESIRGFIRGIDNIEIKAEVAASISETAGMPICALILAGWFIDRLSLEVISSDGAGFECMSLSGKTVRIVLKCLTGGAESRLLGTILTCHGAGGEWATIKLERKPRGSDAPPGEYKEILETSVEVHQNLHMIRPLEDEGSAALIRRFFQVGEATASYYSALRGAVDMEGLRPGGSV